MPGTVPETVKSPETLTNADWQKKKGALAKMAGTTDIGADDDCGQGGIR